MIFKSVNLITCLILTSPLVLQAGCNPYDELYTKAKPPFSMGVIRSRAGRIRPKYAILSPKPNINVNQLTFLLCQIEITSPNSDQLPEVISLLLRDKKGRERGYGAAALPKSKEGDRYLFQGAVKTPKQAGIFFANFVLRYRVGDFSAEAKKFVNVQSENIIIKSGPINIEK